MKHSRPEDERVKIPALIHFTRLGYEYISIKNKEKSIDYDEDTNIFYSLFMKSVNKINNTDLSLEQIKKIINELKIKLSNDDLGKSFFEVLQKGMNDIKLIDFNNIDNNSFTVVTELPYSNGDDNFRPDIVVLINGMPLSFMEVKRHNNKDGILAERNRMITRFSNDIYKRFVNITQMMVFSNNNEYDDTESEPIQGSFYATSSYKNIFFSRFREERYQELVKRLNPIDTIIENLILRDNNLVTIKSTNEYKSSIQADTPTNMIITSLYTKERLIFMLHYGICYREKADNNGITHIEKHIMRYPQFFATLSIKDTLDNGIKKGIIWHTQGSGKTALAYSNVRYLKDYFQKKNTTAKFYFIVDRLDLATQAKSEFEARGLNVELVNSKEDFKKSINIIGENNTNGKDTITVVNIQKFSEDSITKQSDYNVNIQRIYFLDEAHRSYNPKGSFLANLQASDRNAIMIALTGTPLIIKGNTKEIFGNYIHKYYYNKSIADGYTLRLIREEIEITYKNRLSKILKGLEVQKGTLSKAQKEIFANKKFVSCMLEYIINDFSRSRIMLDDNSIGSMIVCGSSEQAREVSKQLEEKYPKYSHALILCDEGSKKQREDYQNDFKNGNIDILVVYNMLLTGFDAPRLKKLYLCRMIREHNLLQALTRVNRPYGKHRFGYVVDFADIKGEFDKTNQAYFKELEAELGSEVENYSQIFKSREEIKQDLLQIKDTLFSYCLDDMVKFTNQISSIDNKDELIKLKKALEDYKILHNNARYMGFNELIDKFDISNAIKMLLEVNNRINIINLKDNISNLDNISAILNIALSGIDFNFRKIKEEELIIADKFKETLEKTRKEIVENCLDTKSPEYVSFLEELKRIFNNKNIEELSADEMKNLIQALENLKRRVQDYNRKDNLLADKYNGDIKYMRIHKRITSIFDNKLLIYGILKDIKSQTDDIISHNENILDNIAFFKRSISKNIVETLKKNSIGINLAQINNISEIISQEYIDERNWKI